MRNFFLKNLKTKSAGLIVGLSLFGLFGSTAFAGITGISSNVNGGTISVSGMQTTIDRPMTGLPGYLDWGFIEASYFSLLSGEQLIVNQSRPDSTLVIRVTGSRSMATSIVGSVESNGRLIVINEKGIAIKGQVETASFMASLLDFSDVDLQNSHVTPIQSQLAGSYFNGLDVTGRIFANGGSYTDKSGVTHSVPGNVYFLAPRITLGYIVSPRLAGGVFVAAGDQVQTFFGDQAAEYTQTITPSSTVTATPRSLVEVSSSAMLGHLTSAASQLRVYADATQAVADQLDAADLSVLQFDGVSIARGDLVIDGGGTGTTQVQGAFIQSLDAATTATIDIFGGSVEVFDSILDTMDGGTGDQVRIGGDESDLGSDRHGTGGTRIAYRTHLNAGVRFQQDAGDHMGTAGYSVLREGEIPLLLVSGHDGALEPSWMLDRDSVYLDTDGDDIIDTCNTGISTTIVTRNDRDIHEMMAGMTDRVLAQTGKRPYTLNFRIARTMVDPNRRPGLATGLCHTTGTDTEKYSFGPNPENNLAYQSHHDLIGVAQQSIESLFGSGLMLDLHGHSSGSESGPLQLGHRIKGTDLRDMLIDAVGPSPTEAHFDNPGFIDRLNNYNAIPGDDLEDMMEDASVRNLAEDSAAPGDDTALWDLMFGADSLFKQMRGKTDASGNDYLLHLVEDVGYTFTMRRGGYILRRHGSSDESDDACDDQVVGNCQGTPHEGFVYNVDAIQFESPVQYRYMLSPETPAKQAIIDQYRVDLADAVMHFLEYVYGHSL